MTTSHTLIHIGAGEGTELAHYQTLTDHRIVLVEPNPQLAQTLRQATEPHSHIEIVEAAVAPKGSNRPLFVYNLAEANSLYEPADALLERFPGLKQREQQTVTLLTPTQLFEHIGLSQAENSQEQQNRLVIQAPGAEGHIIADLIATGQLYLFTTLQITTGNAAYYRTPEHNSYASAITKALQLAGYEAKEPDNTENSDWPEWAFHYNPMHAELKKAHTKNQELQTALKEAQQAQEALQQKHNTVLESTRKQAEEEKAKLKRELEETKAQHAQALEKHTKAHQTALAEKETELKKQLENAQAQVKKLTEETAAQNKTQTEQHKQHKQQQEEIQQLKQRRDQLKKELEETKAQHAQALEKHTKAHQTALAEKETELKKQLENAQAQVKKLTEETAAQNKTQTEQHKQQLEAVNKELADHKEWLTNRKKELETAKHTLEAEQKAHAELKKQAEQHETQTEQAQNQLKQNAEEIQQLKQRRDDLKKQLEQTQKEKEQQTNELKQTRKDIEHLQQQLKQLQEQTGKDQTSIKALETLQKRMEYLFDQNTLQLEQAANALGHHITHTTQSTARELEAGFALQQQFGADLPTLEDQGYRLPSAVALQLARQLKTQPYDLIIEMGSGVSTTFMAHTLRNQNKNGPTERSGEQSVAQYIDASEDDLPKRILCFEHSRTQYNKLQSTLKNSALEALVGAQFAPLVNFTHQGQDHLFYDCAAKLQHIARLFEQREARIFIFINPTGNEVKPSVKAALPQILQYLAAHRLHIVVNTGQTEGLTNEWQQLLDARGMAYSPSQAFGEASMSLFSINS